MTNKWIIYTVLSLDDWFTVKWFQASKNAEAGDSAKKDQIIIYQLFFSIFNLY